MAGAVDVHAQVTRKVNVVLDALSRQAFSMGSLVAIRIEERPLARDVQRLANELVRLQLSDQCGVLAFIESRSSLMDQICERQFEDEKLYIIWDKVARGEVREAVLDLDGVLRIGSRICVFKMGDLIRLILEETHCTWYSIHPGATKMYHDLSQHYW